MVDIFEERYEGLWKNTDGFQKQRDAIMSQEQIKRVDWYIGKWYEQRGSIGEELEEWEHIEDLCGGDREDNGSGQDKAYVNVITPNTEGQVASLTNYNISAKLKGRGVGDEKFKATAEPIVDFILEHNNIRNLVKKSGRKYLRLGNVFCTVGWNPDAYDGMGAPEIKVRKITDILPDKKVRDPDELDTSDYIIDEVGQMSILWAEREYGEEVARAIQTGNAMQDFKEKYEMDDQSSFTMLRVWTKLNETGNLQMILMSACGVLLEESSEAEPYYTTVYNRYPVFYAGLYPQEGKFYRFGDGRLLAPIQELINKLYDEIILAIQFQSQGRTYVDPEARMNVEDFAECDPSKPIIAKAPNQNIKVSQGVGINTVVYSLLQQLFQQVQEVTRFSTLMTGQSAGDRTATESNILAQQGATGVDDKKADLSTMLGEAVLYAFALCLENWPSAVALRIADDKDDFIWVDPTPLKNVPEMIPASSQYIQDWKNKQPKRKRKDTPKWMALEIDEEVDDEEAEPEITQDEEGNDVATYPKKTVKKTATNQIKLDLTLSIGEGMPTNKVAMYNILLSLAQLQLIDEATGTPKPLLTRQRVVDMLEDILGIQIDVDEEGDITANGQKLTQNGGNPIVPPVNNSATTPNANISGNLAGKTA